MEMCCGFFGNAALREIFQIPTVYRQGDIDGKIEIGIGVDWIANFGRRLCLRAPSCRSEIVAISVRVQEPRLPAGS